MGASCIYSLVDCIREGVDVMPGPIYTLQLYNIISSNSYINSQHWQENVSPNLERNRCYPNFKNEGEKSKHH